MGTLDGLMIRVSVYHGLILLFYKLVSYLCCVLLVMYCVTHNGDLSRVLYIGTCYQCCTVSHVLVTCLGSVRTYKTRDRSPVRVTWHNIDSIFLQDPRQVASTCNKVLSVMYHAYVTRTGSLF